MASQSQYESELIEARERLNNLESELEHAKDRSTKLETEAAQKDLELESKTVVLSNLETEYQQQGQSLNNANAEIVRLKDERDQVTSDLQETRNKLSTKEGELDAAMERSTITNATISAVLGAENVLSDIVRLHQAAQSVPPSTQIRGEIIASIQVTRAPSTIPTYQDAFELWMSAAKGTLDVDRASIFLQPPNLNARFLPWIHDALCKSTDALEVRLDASAVWSKDLLVQLVTLMQLLVFVQHAYPASEWKPNLVNIFSRLSNSSAVLPNSTIFPTIQKRVQRFLNSGDLPSSWIDTTPNPSQLDSTNSLLNKDTCLILDSTADTLVLVTGKPQVVYLLGHDDIECLEIKMVCDMTLKLRSPLPILSLPLQDFESTQTATDWSSHAWFDEHIVVI